MRELRRPVKFALGKGKDKIDFEVLGLNAGDYLIFASLSAATREAADGRTKAEAVVETQKFLLEVGVKSVTGFMKDGKAVADVDLVEQLKAEEIDEICKQILRLSNLLKSEKKD